MVSANFTIKNSEGLHMRPAGVLVKAVTPFNSSVTIIFNGNEVNAKSIMHVIGACIKCGAEIEVRCDGDDEVQALETVTKLVESGFGE